MTYLEKMRSCWSTLYQERAEEDFQSLIAQLDQAKENHFAHHPIKEPHWYQDAVIYSLYVDLFQEDFHGLKSKLSYLKSLGVNCLWLLPVLDSPMRDAGYDVRDYLAIRPELAGVKTKEEALVVFEEFLAHAREEGIRVIFDLVLNHCSFEHPFFKEAKNNPESPYRDYFIWSSTGKEYSQARIIFQGLCTSNWEYVPENKEYYLHRFYESQPDWNYRNPKLIQYMVDIMIFWRQRGIDGFRLDAIPYLWKEEGSNCESLPQCHQIIKLLRAAMDYLQPGALLLAEACQPTEEIVRYFGQADECQAAYHFPLMRQIFACIATQEQEQLSRVFQETPAIPEKCQWFLFLRCHDELTLEMTTPHEQDLMNRYYCKDPAWSFREGQGIASRLYHLLDEEPAKVLLAYSILFTLPGTPILYYGDEVATENNPDFFDYMYKLTGHADTRNLCRGKLDWAKIETDLSTLGSPAQQIFSGLQKLLRERSQSPALRQGQIQFSPKTSSPLLRYERNYGEESFLIIHNLGSKEIEMEVRGEDILENLRFQGEGKYSLGAYQSAWVRQSSFLA